QMPRLLPFILLALLALACAPSQRPADSPSSGGPRPGGVLKVRAGLDPHDWDITYSGKDNANFGRVFAQESLLRLANAPDSARRESIIRPLLAETWEVSPDARSFTFHLRKGATFAPGGRELTSDDVRWSMEYESRTGRFSKLPAANVGWML